MSRLKICIFLYFLSGLVFAQTGKYAIINIYRTADPYPKLPVEVTIANQKPFSLLDENHLFAQFKVYTGGRIQIKATNTEHSALLNLSVYPGNQYYLYIKLNNNNAIQEITDKYEARRKFLGIKDTLFAQEDSVNRIIVEEKYRDKSKPVNGSGTGFLISNSGIVVTNAHVVEDANKIKVKGIGGDILKEYVGKVLVKDNSNDLALIQLEGFDTIADTIPYSMRTLGVLTGENVFILGYPMADILGQEIKLSTGVVSSKSGYQGNYGSFQVSAVAQPGSSGSPLFDEYGSLIGIINAKIMEGEGITYAVKVIYLKSLLDVAGVSVDLKKSPSLTVPPLKDLVRSYSNYIYLVEVEK